MADSFGTRKGGRVHEGGKFYAEPAVNVPANAIYFPYPSGGGLFGVAEYPVLAGEKGAFATRGTFAFEKPKSFDSEPGDPVFYKPSGPAAGALRVSAATGCYLIGYDVSTSETPPDLIYIDIRG